MSSFISCNFPQSVINPKDIVGAGGFGVVYGLKFNQNTVIKCIGSTLKCSEGKEEFTTSRTLIKKLSESDAYKNPYIINLFIPYPFCQSNEKFEINECEEKLSNKKVDCEGTKYSCTIMMEKVPYFNPEIKLSYQLYLLDEIKQLPDDPLDGRVMYNQKKIPRGLFIDENHLLNLEKSYKNFSAIHTVFSLGYWVGKLLIDCKFDLKDVEYILSRNGTDVCLYMIDFGMSTFWNTQADLIETCENLQIEPTLPSSKSNKYYNQFLSGFVEYVRSCSKNTSEEHKKYTNIVLEKFFETTPEQSIEIYNDNLKLLIELKKNNYKYNKKSYSDKR